MGHKHQTRPIEQDGLGKKGIVIPKRAEPGSPARAGFARAGVGSERGIWVSVVRAKPRSLASLGMTILKATDRRTLHAKRRATAAGALHVRILELEACSFESLDVVSLGALQ